MKKVCKWGVKVLLFVTIVSQWSCEAIEEATQVDFNESFTVELDVQIEEADPSYQGSLVIDLASNPDLRDYLDKIETIQITQANYFIRDFQGDAQANGTAQIGSVGQVFGPFSHQFQSDSQSQKRFALTGGTKLQALANNLKNNNQITLNYQVTQDQASDSNFTVVLTLVTAITAQAL